MSHLTPTSQSVFAKIDQEFGGLDFVVHGAAFAPREELTSPFVQHDARRVSGSRSTFPRTR